MSRSTSLPIVSDGLSHYLSGIRKYPFLTKEEEFALAEKYYLKHDLSAAEKLVMSNLRLVVKIAYEYTKSGLKLMDLIQEGNIGLMQAVKEFNPYKETRLATYATWWIKAYIQNFLLKNWSMVKIGTTQNQRKLFYNLEKEKRKLEQDGFKPEVKLLSEKLGVKEEEIEEMQLRLSGKEMSLDAPIRGSDSEKTLMDYQPDYTIDMETDIVKKDMLKKFEAELDKFEKTLNEKQKFIFHNRLLSDSPMTLQEIGDHYGITRERVRQLESTVFKKLKNYIEKNSPEMKDAFLMNE